MSECISETGSRVPYRSPAVNYVRMSSVCVIAPDMCEHVCVQLHVNPMLYCVLLCCLLLLLLLLLTVLGSRVLDDTVTDNEDSDEGERNDDCEFNDELEVAAEVIVNTSCCSIDEEVVEILSRTCGCTK